MFVLHLLAVYLYTLDIYKSFKFGCALSSIFIQWHCNSIVATCLQTHRVYASYAKFYLTRHSPIQQYFNLLAKYNMQWLYAMLSQNAQDSLAYFFFLSFHFFPSLSACVSFSVYSASCFLAQASLKIEKLGNCGGKKIPFNLIFSLSRILLLFAILRYGFFFAVCFFFLFNRLPDKSQNDGGRKHNNNSWIIE